MNLSPFEDIFQIYEKEDFNALCQISNKNCTMILFYDDNKTSIIAYNIWKKTACDLSPKTLGICSISNNPKVEEILIKFLQDSSMKDIKIQKYPFVLIYNNGSPISFYKGIFTSEAIIDFILDHGCIRM
jgi:hypothetical protein